MNVMAASNHRQRALCARPAALLDQRPRTKIAQAYTKERCVEHPEGTSARELSIRVIRPLEVTPANGRQLAIAGRRAQALLGYLATQSRRRESRDRLAALFWGDRFEDQARHSLRQAILTLRKTLNCNGHEFLAAGQNEFVLSADRVEVDLAQVQLLAQSDDLNDLRRAAELCRGDLLEGLSLPADAFTEWLDRERSRFRGLSTDISFRLARVLAASGDIEGAIESAKHAIMIDPAFEECHRMIMELYRKSGNRTAALKQYRDCVGLLRREIDAEPEARTQMLARDIREPAAREALHPGSAPASSPKESGEPVPDTAADVSSIVVLPFRNVGGGQTGAGIVDGITEEITAALSMVSGMFVIARITALAYRDRLVDAHEVAGQLGVRYALDGAVWIEDGRIRVIVSLIDTAENCVMWTYRYDDRLASVFDLNDKITFEVITALKISITEGEQERIALIHGTRNLQAWLTAGQALLHVRRMTCDDNAMARTLYIRAAEADPAYPAAWDGLAWTHFIDAHFGWSSDPVQSINQARDFAQRTLELDTGRPATCALLGGVALADGRHESALALAQKAVSMSPNGADVTAVLAFIMTFAGKPEDAVRFILRAMRLSPRYPDWYRWTLGRAYRLAGDYKNAIASLSPLSDNAESSIAPAVELAAAYAQSGRYDEARIISATVLTSAPSFTAAAWTAIPPYSDAAVAASERKALEDAGLPG
jgi:DNA-binding SARP family transcriptional activator/TolB-like protein